MTRSRKSATGSAQPLPWWELAVLTLLLGRLYLPAEASDRGLTLWLAAATFLLLSVRMWRGWRDAEPIPLRRPHLYEWGLIFLVGGHLLSAGYAAWMGGNRRAILNLSWEWGSIAAMLMLLRGCIQSASFRQLLTAGLLTVAVTLSLLGCWQHFVWYPANARMAQRLQELESQAHLNQTERKEREDLVAQIPDWDTTSETGRQMLFARLAESREPIGTFALANTFAGLLLVLLLLATDQTFALWNNGHCRWVLLGVLALTAYCLLLTKARTAYVGALAGLGLWGAMQIWHSQPKRRSQLRKVLLVGVGLIACGLMVAMMSGSLDREVLTEAFKSFRYRIEYWTATLQMLQDHPLLGCGPGNFRQMYLQYKLPGSSEEILDPHNIVLDVWANGGLMALTGAGVMVVGLFQSLLRPRNLTSTPLPTPLPMTFRMACGALPVLLIWLGRGALDGWLDPTLGWLLLISVFASPLLLVCCHSPLSLTWLAAWVALSLHLCGAGGIGMPAILQLWLLTWMASTCAPQAPSEARSVSSPKHLWLGGIVVGLLLAFGCLWTGVIPVTSVNHLLAQAHRIQRTDSRQAARLMEIATQADKLSPEPWQELALYHLSQWKQSPRWNAEHFQQALDAQKSAIERDPRAGKRYHLQGQAWGLKFSETGDPEDAERGIESYRAGIQRYPNFAPLHADLALLLRDANLPSESEARQALRLDDLNRSAGHTDKLLPSEQRKSLEVMASKAD